MKRLLLLLLITTACGQHEEVLTEEENCVLIYVKATQACSGEDCPQAPLCMESDYE